MTEIDVRGPRFSAALTCAVLAAAVVARAPALLAVQVGVFAVAALAGLRWSPYGNLFRLLKRRLDLGPPPATEPEAGPRFSQLMGLLFTGAGLAAILAGAPTLGWSLVLVVVALSGVLAATGLCVGCRVHAVAAQLRGRRGATGGRGATGLDPARLRRLGVPAGAVALVELTAPGCVSCAAARRVLDAVAADRADVAVVAVDVAADPALARDFRVLRAPTTLVVAPDGALRARLAGVPAPAAVARALDGAKQEIRAGGTNS